MPESKPQPTKESLEILKLQAEITSAKKWWVAPVIQAAPATLLAIATVWIASSSGLLDAKRDNIAAQNVHLEMKRMKLEGEKQEVESQLATLKEQLSQAKRQLLPFTTQKEIETELSKLPLSTWLEYSEKTSSFSARIQHANVIGNATPGKIPGDSPLLSAIKILSRVENLTGLSINNLKLSVPELQAIGSLSSLDYLSMGQSRLTNEHMQHFPTLPKLRTLFMSGDDFSELGVLNRCTGLLHLMTAQTPLSDDGLQQLGDLKMTIRSLLISQTQVTNRGARFMSLCPRLETVDVSRCPITEDGIRTIAENKTVTKMYTDTAQISADATQNLKEMRPDLVINPFVPTLMPAN